MPRVSNDILQMALIGYESQRAKVEAAIADLQARLGHRGPGRPRTSPDGAGQSAGKKRTLSAAGRRRIALAQKKRWAALKKAKATPEQQREKPKRKISSAGRAAIVAATKKRWAAYHKAQKARTATA